MPREGNQSVTKGHILYKSVYMSQERQDLQTEGCLMVGVGELWRGHRLVWGNSLKSSYSAGFVSCVCTIHLKSHMQMGRPHDMQISISTTLFFKNKI